MVRPAMKIWHEANPCIAATSNEPFGYKRAYNTSTVGSGMQNLAGRCDKDSATRSANQERDMRSYRGCRDPKTSDDARHGRKRL